MKKILFTILMITSCIDTSTPTTDETSGDDAFEESSFDESSSGSSEDSESSSSATLAADESSSDASSSGELQCDAELHGTCEKNCTEECGLVCRPNYIGGALEECTTECEADAECASGVCSAGFCIVPCGPELECPEGLFCYPNRTIDGEPIIDPQHPVPHCMPEVP